MRLTLCAIMILFLVIISARTACSFEHLLPCTALTSKHESWAKYYDIMNRMLVSKLPSKSKPLFSMIIQPAFEPEKAILLYKNPKNRYTVKSIDLDKSLWKLILEKNYSESRNRPGVRSNKKEISSGLPLQIHKVVEELINDAKTPQKANDTKLQTIDGSVFMFLSDKKHCGFTHGLLMGDRPSMIVDLGNLLYAYAKSASTQTDRSLINSMEERLRELRASIAQESRENE